MPKLAGLFFISLWFIFGGAACVSVQTSAQEQLHFSAFTQNIYPAKSLDAPVDLFYKNSPAKDYDVIGEISGSVIGNVRELLKVRARQLGADAVMIEETTIESKTEPADLRVRQGVFPGETEPVFVPSYSYDIFSVKAKAVKYK